MGRLVRLRGYMDEKIIIVSAKTPDEFETKVNRILKDVDARVVQTEMSVTDHHYYAMIVVLRSTTDEGDTKTNRACEAGELKELQDIYNRLDRNRGVINAMETSNGHLLQKVADLIQKREGLARG